MSYFRNTNDELRFTILIYENNSHKVFFSFVHRHSYIVNEMWGGEDSNLRRRRQQIYSLPHLTTLVPPRM
jgi:hypothetical protein